ncbi:MAG: hypothetical protein KA492_12980 [Bacteroidia bacterium]|nr:hypothetical protein [Bacteroidia bacterium]
MKSLFKISVLVNVLRLLVLLISPVGAAAQPFVDLFNAKMQFFPAHSYATDNTNKLSGYQAEASFLLPMEQKNKDVILVGGDYTQLHFKESGSINLQSDLYSTSLILGADLGLKNPKWRTTLLVLPKINSDYKDISTDDMQMGGVAMFSYKKKDNLKYHFGLYYNREFFGDYFLPLLGIDWKINQRMNLFGDLPNTMNFEYKISKSLYTGAALFTCISSYRLSAASGGMYVREGDKTMGHDEIKIYVNAYLTKHLVWYAEAGETFYRTYTLFNSNNELQETTSIYRKSNDGMFVNTGIAYRFRLEE